MVLYESTLQRMKLSVLGFPVAVLVSIANQGINGRGRCAVHKAERPGTPGDDIDRVVLQG